MAVLSKQLAAKILGSEWSFGYNCYEVGHTWTPSCTAAALEVSLAAATKIMPLYAMLYSFSQLAVARKYDLPASVDTLKSTLRSSFFIFFHAYNGSLMGCALRHSLGRFYYRVLVCAPALLSSYFSLLIEKRSRRQALAFYMLNMASEIIYRMAVTKGYFRSMKHGETLLFASSLAAWYYLIKTEGFGHDPVSGAVKFLVGRDEAHSRARRKLACAESGSAPDFCATIAESHDSSEQPSADGHEQDDKAERAARAKRLEQLRNVVRRLSLGSIEAEQLKHATCPHEEDTCLGYIFRPAPARFALGYAISTLLRLSRNPVRLYVEPASVLREALASSNSIRFGLFLASLVSTGRLASCALRHHSNANCAWHGAASGFVAGLSMLWAPNSSLSMYVMWKAVEQYYLLAARRGQVRYVDFTIQSIYAASAAAILYTFALEPRFVRPSYMKFLDNLSDHRLHQLNRMVLDVFGTGSSVGYEDYFPDLDPRYMSNQFKELVFNWMIQPYE